MKYEATVSVNANGPYSPAGFSPPTGLYRWTAEYSGDTNNEAAGLVCNAANQSSEVTEATPGLSGVATSTATVGSSITNTVTISGGFNPTGQIVFNAFGPADGTCTGRRRNMKRLSPSLTTTNTRRRVLAARRALSLDRKLLRRQQQRSRMLCCNAANQASNVTKATPGLAGTATSTVIVGSPITDSVTISGGFLATGQILFRAFGPADENCAGAVKYTKNRSPSPVAAPTHRPASHHRRALPLDRQLLGRWQQRSGSAALQRREPGLGGRNGRRDPDGAERHQQHGRETPDRDGIDLQRGESERADHVQGVPSRRPELLQRRGLQHHRQRRRERLLPLGRVRAGPGRNVPLDSRLLGRRQPCPGDDALRQSHIDRLQSEPLDHQRRRGHAAWSAARFRSPRRSETATRRRAPSSSRSTTRPRQWPAAPSSWPSTPWRSQATAPFHSAPFVPQLPGATALSRPTPATPRTRARASPAIPSPTLPRC